MEFVGKRVKIIKADSPSLKAHGIRIGDTGITLPNDSDVKYDYRIAMDRNLVLYFYADEIEIMEKE